MYDTNNRLITFNGNTVSYDMDGNMLSNGYINCEFDSGNRLISAGGHTYTYNAEDVRIRNLCSDADTTYTYNTNCKLSQLLQKTTNNTTTKYVYGHGLIGEDKCGEFKTYHFDYRGSTVAITDECGNITDTFKYDTYGKLISRTGNSFVILGYNGRDGVVTDRNGLLYMRARYYSPDMRRFINADIISGEISDSTSLNRYSYVNGNPVSFVDPFGLAKERGSVDISSQLSPEEFEKLKEIWDSYEFSVNIAEWQYDSFYWFLKNGVKNAVRPHNIAKGVWEKQLAADLKWIDDILGPTSFLGESIDAISSPWIDIASIATDVAININQNIQEGEDFGKIVWDASVDAVIGGTNVYLSTAVGASVGSMIPVPVLGTIAGGIVGAIVGIGLDFISSSGKEQMKSWVG